MAKHISWVIWTVCCAAALVAGAAAKAGEPWFVSSGFGESFEGRDGGALYFAVGEKLNARCKKTLSGGIKQVTGKKGMGAWSSWAGCLALMSDAAFKILIHEDTKAGGLYNRTLSQDQKRWRKERATACDRRGDQEGFLEMECLIQAGIRRISLFNLWYYQFLRSNPEGIYPTEYEWIWDIDPAEEPPNRVCLVAKEPINLRQSPLVNAKGGGKILGKFQAGSKIEGIYYFGRQEGPCKQWLYGASGSNRGFVCTRLSGQELFKACP